MSTNVAEQTTTALPEALPIDLVAREAERLDRLFPGWHNRINIATLDLWSGEDCVLGQATGDYDFAISAVYNDGYDSRCVYSDDARFRDDWIREINKRRA